MPSTSGIQGSVVGYIMVCWAVNSHKPTQWSPANTASHGCAVRANERVAGETDQDCRRVLHDVVWHQSATAMPWGSNTDLLFLVHHGTHRLRGNGQSGGTLHGGMVDKCRGRQNNQTDHDVDFITPHLNYNALHFPCLALAARSRLISVLL